MIYPPLQWILRGNSYWSQADGSHLVVRPAYFLLSYEVVYNAIFLWSCLAFGRLLLSVCEFPFIVYMNESFFFFSSFFVFASSGGSRKCLHPKLCSNVSKITVIKKIIIMHVAVTQKNSCSWRVAHLEQFFRRAYLPFILPGNFRYLLVVALKHSSEASQLYGNAI